MKSSLHIGNLTYIMNCEQILRQLEDILPDSQVFENIILKNIRENYFPFLSHSLYSQLNYSNPQNRKFTTEEFKKLLNKNHFLFLVNDVYRTRVSNKGLKIITDKLNEADNFDNYRSSITIFEDCNPRRQKNGENTYTNAFSLGTKILHFYNPEENPIMDSVVRTNLKIDYISCEICYNYRDAARKFVRKHPDYFNNFRSSNVIISELKERGITTSFPNMAILDLALYSY